MCWRRPERHNRIYDVGRLDKIGRPVRLWRGRRNTIRTIAEYVGIPYLEAESRLETKSVKGDYWIETGRPIPEGSDSHL